MMHQWCSALQQRCPPVPAPQQLLLLAASRPGTGGSAVLIPAAWQPQELVQERQIQASASCGLRGGLVPGFVWRSGLGTAVQSLETEVQRFTIVTRLRLS